MLPRVILHNAVSVDGRIDGFPVDIGLYYQLAAGWKEDATLVGCDTLLAAPEEIAREDQATREPPPKQPDDTRPLLVVTDSRGRLRSWHHWRRQSYWRDGISLCSKTTPPDHMAYLEDRRIESIITSEERVDLPAALEELNRRHGVETVRVDSGGRLNGALLRAGLVGEVNLLIHSSLVGGVSPRTMFQADDQPSGGDIKLKLTHLEQLKDDIIWLRYDVGNKSL
jgi:2,5-diamino-6-(ribosylamino)-4(3H)-pyrimidinone 5'-phosphate reductase